MCGSSMKWCSLLLAAYECGNRSAAAVYDVSIEDSVSTRTQTPDKATKICFEDAVSTRTQRLTHTPDKAAKRGIEDAMSIRTQRLTQTPDRTRQPRDALNTL